MPKVYVSAVIPAPIEDVWARIRDFNALPEWHPAIAESRIEEDRSSDSVGCVRNFVLKPDARIREVLLALSDHEHLVTYQIIEAPVPVENYVATLRLRPITLGNQTFGEWEATFDCPAEEESNLTNLVREAVFEAGLKALGE